MAGSLLDLVSAVKTRPIATDAVEEAVKIAVILPVLDRLGWDWVDPQEVVPEYGLMSQRVDFCLRINGVAKVFVEAKRPSEDLDSHQEQLLNYAFREGVDLAVLTNGLTWWFYLPTANGSWEQRKFFAIDFRLQDAEAVATHLSTFLGRDAVSGGAAVRSAREVLETASREQTIRAALPVAWNRLLTEPDELLVDLLAEAVEGQSGHRPPTEAVAAFLASRASAVAAPQKTIPPRAAAPSEASPIPLMAGIRETGAGAVPAYTGRNLEAFSLFNERHAASTWRHVLLTVASELYRRHGGEFERVLSIRGRKRNYFSTNRNELFLPGEIPGSPYFAETNLSANDIVKRCEQLLALFGYPATALSIHTT